EYIKKHKISGKSLETFNTALAQIAAKNHQHATKNKYAQYQREIQVETVLQKRLQTSKPLGIYDFAPISDGAAALVLASHEMAKEYADTPIYIVGSSSATDYITFPARENRTGFVASTTAMENALKMADLEMNEIDMAELYDQSTLLEMTSLEDLGFSKRGQAWLDIHNSCKDYEGFYQIEGKKLFVNTNGGLKADGNPLGATGGAQIFELVKQLKGEAGDRQAQANRDLRFGCALELEGFGTKAYIHILGRD
ncbi:MAG: thiolase domain-containing protein, partial [Candidatus Bathyarchaeota archaeon]